VKRLLLVATLAAACTASPSVSIGPLPPVTIPEGRPVTVFNAEEMLEQGRFLDVQSFIERFPRSERESSSKLSFLYGRALSARGNVTGATQALDVALALSSGARAEADVEWALTQALLQTNDFEGAARHGEEAARRGQSVAPGFVRFLRALALTPLYGEWPQGRAAETPFSFGGFDLIRVPVRVNAVETAAILDSGASYCIVTRSFARTIRLREIPESDAWGRGFHKTWIPLTFGVADRLELAGLALTNVPAMIMPDQALSFETGRGKLPIGMVVGLHLLKEFRLSLDYAGRRLSLTRVEPGGPKSDPEQNLFFVRNKVMVRVSANLAGWHLFLLDTGSEPTMLTSAGVRRMGLSASSMMSPREVFGIGKSRVEWGRVRRVALGLDNALVRFNDLVLADVDNTIEDGIIGSSYLKHFAVTIDFESMRLSLQSRP